MSFWKKLFRREAAEPEVEEEAFEEPPLDEVREDVRPLDDPERILEQAGDGPGDTLDERHLLDQIDELQGRGREARAIDLARRVLTHYPELSRVHQRVAEMLASRGDDEGADRLLTPFVDRRDATLDLLMLAAEIAERRGDRTRALGLYERIVAQDLDYPRARARVRRMREGERRGPDAGATLMADGVLTRGRYRVERELGRGGAGTVFLADDLELGRKVALKVYHRRGRAERERLLAEARTPARFEHPGVVRIFDLDESLAAIAMERVIGGSVRAEINKGGLLLPRITRWFETAADALAFIHAAGVVYRDFKPSNLLLRADDRGVLTDFGLACKRGWSPPGGAAAAEGTLAYMSPEQRSSAPASSAMDIYALGASLEEVLEHSSTPAPEWLISVAKVCRRRDASARPDAAWVRDELRRNAS